MSFEKATKAHLRFKTSVGLITTEDLWDLTLPSLDILAKSLNKEIKESAEESFIATKTKASNTLELKFEIVKHVIKVKLEEAEAAKTAGEKRAKKQHLLELIQAKQNEALSQKSVDELLKELDALDS